METVWGFVDWQRVLNPVKCKLAILNSVCNPAHNATKIRSETFLLASNKNSVNQPSEKTEKYKHKHEARKANLDHPTIHGQLRLHNHDELYF